MIDVDRSIPEGRRTKESWESSNASRLVHLDDEWWIASSIFQRRASQTSRRGNAHSSSREGGTANFKGQEKATNLVYLFSELSTF